MKLTKAELNLLVYLESRAVYYGGTVDVSRMNEGEMELAQRMNDEGLIWFGEKGAAGSRRGFNHYVVLTYAAWQMSAADRQRRARDNHIADPNVPAEALEAITGGK